MNVLLVNRMMGVAWGGGENYDYNLACALAAKGHRITVLTGRKPGETPIHEVGGFSAHSVTTPYLRKYMYDLAGKLRYLPGILAELDLRWFRLAALRRIDELAQSKRFDVVQVLGIPSLARDLARRGWPVAMRFPGPPAWFQGRLLKRLATGGKVAMFSHGDTVRYFDERLKISIPEVPPGVQAELYCPPKADSEKLETRRELGLSADDFTLITVGRLVHGKGHDLLLDAFQSAARRIGNLRLLIVGDGPLRPRMETKARNLGIERRVEFTGHKNNRDVARYLRASDLFCLFSDYENYSNAVLEAMATGLPTVATRVGGFPSQITEGVNGYLLEPGSIHDLGDLIERLESQSGLKTQLSLGARRFAARFSWEQSADRVSEVYEQLVTA